jgi:hypothetical protein
MVAQQVNSKWFQSEPTEFFRDAFSGYPFSFEIDSVCFSQFVASCSSFLNFLNKNGKNKNSNNQ